MTPLKILNSEFFYYFRHYYQSEAVYCQPLEIDIDQNRIKYDILKHFPARKDEINNFFKRIFTDNHLTFQLSDFLQDRFCNPDRVKQLTDAGFKVLNIDIRSNLVLEHPDLSPWIIKKNYSEFFSEKDQKFKRIYKAVDAPNIPDSIVSFSSPPNAIVTYKKTDGLNDLKMGVYHDYRNPLRAEISRRGIEWINYLGLNRIQVVQEYLYFLPTANPQDPIHQRTIILSKKVSVLHGKANTDQYVKIATETPSELQEIAYQICLFIKHTQMIDNHLDDICFLADGSNKVIFLDCEPGNLLDVTQDKIHDVQNFDPRLFSIVGLRNFQYRLRGQFLIDAISSDAAAKTQKIFDDIINQMVDQIMKEYPSLIKKIITKFFDSANSLVTIASFAKKILVNLKYSDDGIHASNCV